MGKGLRRFILFPNESQTVKAGQEERFLRPMLSGDNEYIASNVICSIAPLCFGKVYITQGQWLALRDSRGWMFRHADELGLENKNPIDVAVSPDGSLLCVISIKKLVSSQDGGRSWREISVPTDDLEWIRLFSTEKMALIGRRGAYFSNNCGETWQRIPVAGVRDVCMSPAISNCLFVTDINGHIHCVYDTTTQQQNDQNTSSLQGVFTLSNKPVLAIFCSNSALYALNKDGIVKYDLGDPSLTPRTVLKSRTIYWAGVCQEERFFIRKRDGLFLYSAQDGNYQWSQILNADPLWFSVCAVEQQSGAFYAGTYSGYLLETYNLGQDWIITCLQEKE